MLDNQIYNAVIRALNDQTTKSQSKESEQKFFPGAEIVIPTVVTAVVNELTNKGLIKNGTQKFFPGAEIVIPAVVTAVVDELTNKGLMKNGTQKFFPGAEIVIPAVVTAVVDELTNKGFSLGAGLQIPGLGGAGINIGIKQYVEKALAEKGLGISSEQKFFPGAEIVIPTVVTAVVNELTNKGLRKNGTQKFFPGAEIVIPAVVTAVVDELTNKGFSLGAGLQIPGLGGAGINIGIKQYVEKALADKGLGVSGEPCGIGPFEPALYY